MAIRRRRTPQPSSCRGLSCRIFAGFGQAGDCSRLPSRPGAGPRGDRRRRKVRFFQADQLIEALYRGLADHTVGKLIERLLRHDFIVMDGLASPPWIVAHDKGITLLAVRAAIETAT